MLSPVEQKNTAPKRINTKNDTNDMSSGSLSPRFTKDKNSCRKNAKKATDATAR